MEQALFIRNICISLPVILLAITFHEVAHGYSAFLFGDKTAYEQGRLTLNPLKHLDPVGTLMLILVHFGWAKPVPVDPRRMRNPKRDMIWVSLAGPATNVLLAFLFSLVLRFLLNVYLNDPALTFEGLSKIVKGNVLLQFGLLFSTFGIVINLFLAMFNLIPIPPLDGSKILGALLPRSMAYKYYQLERKGPLLIIGLVLLGNFTGVSIILLMIKPFANFFSNLFAGMGINSIYYLYNIILRI